MIGVIDVNKLVAKPEQRRFRPFDRFWGWDCIETSKVRPSPSDRADFVPDHYGQSIKIGDTVGCIMEFKDNLLSLSFTINQVNQGVCHKEIPASSYYPTVVLARDGAMVTLNSQADLNHVTSKKKSNEEE